MTILTSDEVIEGFSTAIQHWNAEAALGCQPMSAHTPILNLVLPIPLMECVPWPGLGSRPEAIGRTDWIEIITSFQKKEMWGDDNATLRILHNAHPFFMDAEVLFGPKLAFCPSGAQTSRFLLDHGIRLSPDSKLCKLFRVTFALYLLTARVVTSSQWLVPEPMWDCDPAAVEPPKFAGPLHTVVANGT